MRSMRAIRASKPRLVEDDALRRGIVLTIDGVANRQGLRAKVAPDSEVHFVPAIGGG